MNLQTILVLIIIIETLLFAMFIPPSFYVVLLGFTFVLMDAVYPSALGLNLKLYNILTICLVFSLLYRYFLKENLPRLSHVKTSVLFLGGIAISILFSEYPTYSLRIVSLEILAIILFWAVSLATVTHEQISRAIRVWLWVSNAVAALEILDMMIGVAGLPRLFPVRQAYMTLLGRPTGWFEEPNRASQYHMLVALWTMPLFMAGHHLPQEHQLASKNLISTSFLLNLIVVLLGVGRASWLGMILGAAVTSVVFYRQNLIKITRTLAIPIFVLAILLVLNLNVTFHTFLEDRLEDTLKEVVVAETELDVIPRASTDIGLMSLAFIKGLDTPWLGHGLGTFPNYHRGRKLYTTETIPGTSYERATEYDVTWNRYVQIFFGAGLLGLLTYLIWQYDICATLMRSGAPVPYRVAFLTAIIGMLWGHDQFRAVIGYAPVYWLMGLALAMERLWEPPEISSQLESVIEAG
jgi:hypothetical protein